MKLIHEGKTMRVYEDPDNKQQVVIEFADTFLTDKTESEEEVPEKGRIVRDLTYHLLGYLEGKGIDTHLIRSLPGSKLLCHRVEPIPVEVVCINVAAGALCERYGIEKGKALETPVFELYLSDDSLRSPLISREAVVALGYVGSQTLGLMLSMASSANHYLTALLGQVDLKAVDLRLRFGITRDDRVVLATEVSADTFTIWDSKTELLDRDAIGNDSSRLRDAYIDLMERIVKTRGEEVKTRRETVEVIVEPRKGVSNPPGEVTKKALVRLGFAEVTDVKVGKMFRITLKGPLSSETLKQLDLMSIKLLSNPISESHQVRS